MRAHGFWRQQFHVYRLWIFERPRGAAGLVSKERSTSSAAASSPAAAVAAEPKPPVQIEFLNRAARGDWARARGADADWSQYRVALTHGHDLAVARLGNEITGWGWIGYDRVYLPPLGREIRLAPGTAYLYDAYVKPAVRGRGLGHALVQARCARADERGIERLVSHVIVGNEASRRSLEAAGFAIVGRTSFLRALLLRVWTREPLPPKREIVTATRAA